MSATPTDTGARAVATDLASSKWRWPEDFLSPRSARAFDGCRHQRAARPLRLVVVVLIAFSAAALSQVAVPPEPGLPQQSIDFRKPLADLPAVALFGPDAADVIRTDAEGLRITLPAGRADCRNVGIELPLGLRGDFAIDAGYEVLGIGDNIADPAAGVQMRLAFADSAVPLVALARFRNRYPPAPVPLFQPVGHDGETFAAYRITVLPNGHEKPQGIDVRAREPRGRLKLARTGGQLQFLVSDGGSPDHLLKTEEVGADDIDSVQLFAFSGWAPVAVDVRFTDLQIRAAGLGQGGPGRLAYAKAWLVATLLLGLGLTLALTMYFGRRK